MTSGRLSLVVLALAPACTASTDLDGNEQEATHCVVSDLPRITLHAPTRQRGALFGSRVAIDGDVLVVSAVEEARPPSTFTEGAVYVFERSGQDWLPTAELRPSDFGFAFGDSIAVKGDTILVGDGNEWDIFHRSATGWNRTGHFRQTGGFDGHIALTDDRLIVGVTGEDINVLFGSAFAYPRSGATFGTPIAIDAGLPNMCESPCPIFGEAVGAEGDLVAVSAPGRGFSEVHVFRGGPTDLVHEATLERPAERIVQTPFGFGEQLAVDGDRIFIADRFTRDGEGAVTVYANKDGSWEQEAYLPGVGDSERSFGLAVGAANGQLLVGAPFTGGFEGNGANPDGAVRLYTRDDYDTWHETAVILDETPRTEFGDAIVMQGAITAIGAPHADDRKGALYLYDLQNQNVAPRCAQ